MSTGLGRLSAGWRKGCYRYGIHDTAATQKQDFKAQGHGSDSSIHTGRKKKQFALCFSFFQLIQSISG